MSGLSLEEYKEKIKRVDDDIESLRREGNTGRKLEILTEYRGYLKDEMEMLQREQNIQRSGSHNRK